MFGRPFCILTGSIRIARLWPLELAALVLWIWLGSILRKLLWGDELNWKLEDEEVLMVVKVQ